MKRRNHILNSKEAALKKSNMLKQAKSEKTLMSKFAVEKSKEQKSFELKMINQEKVLLERVSYQFCFACQVVNSKSNTFVFQSQLHRSIFKETIAIRVDEKRQVKKREDALKQLIEIQIEVSNRIAQSNSAVHNEQQFCRAQREFFATKLSLSMITTLW